MPIRLEGRLAEAIANWPLMVLCETELRCSALSQFSTQRCKIVAGKMRAAEWLTEIE
jgi:hypothetical protein